MKFIFLLLIIKFFKMSNAFWSACPGTNLPTLDSMEAIRCTNKCQVTRGEVFHATLIVTFKKTHQELKSKVTAFILFGIGINLPLDPSLENQCNTILFTNGTKADCPTIPNIQYLLPIKMPIKMFYPTFTNTKVQGEYFDGNERILCFEIVADVL